MKFHVNNEERAMKEKRFVQVDGKSQGWGLGYSSEVKVRSDNPKSPEGTEGVCASRAQQRKL